MHFLEVCNSGEMRIFWEDLAVTVQQEDRGSRWKFWGILGGNDRPEKLEILKGVSGYADSGNLVAIMGPSGAGKTTFLAALARRCKLARGLVRINGQVVSREEMSRLASYLPQVEAMPSCLTAKEYMLFTCALKMDKGTASAERKSLSERLLLDLGLQDCEGLQTARLSGGQRKRLSLATELIARPRILFLDEPTTGLDTFSAMSVVQALKFISLNETIVFCTIHQPGMAIYNLFSHVLLMANGRINFSGTLDDATEFFSSQGFVCPVGFDESEYYVNILSGSSQKACAENSETRANLDCSVKLYRAFLRSPLSKIPRVGNSTSLKIGTHRKPGCIVQFFWIMWRTCVQSRRAIFADWISWLSYALSVLAVGVFYAGIDSKTQPGVQSTRGALYMMTSEIIFTVAYSVIYELPGDILVYLRESQLYGSGPYYAATIFGLMPKVICKALLFTVVLYFTLNSEIHLVNFSLYCLCTLAAAACGTAYGLMISSWIASVEIATTIMVPIDMLFLLTAGMFYNLRVLPAYLACLKYSSIFFYVNEALSIIYWTQIDKIECQADSELPCLSNGIEVLSEYGYRTSNFWWDLGGLVLLTILMILVGYLGLRRRRRTKSIF